MRIGGLGRGRAQQQVEELLCDGGLGSGRGGGGRGGQGAGGVAAVEDGAAGAVDGAEEGGFGYSASCTNAGD